MSWDFDVGIGVVSAMKPSLMLSFKSTIFKFVFAIDYIESLFCTAPSTSVDVHVVPSTDNRIFRSNQEHLDSYYTFNGPVHPLSVSILLSITGIREIPFIWKKV